MQAKRRVKVADNRGNGKASAILLDNTADIAQYKAMQERSADSYAGILKELDAKPDEMLAYMKTRIIRDHRSDKTTLGLELPSAVAAGGSR